MKGGKGRGGGRGDKGDVVALTGKTRPSSYSSTTAIVARMHVGVERQSNVASGDHVRLVTAVPININTHFK
eukprot:scaffold44979_cov31-Tisochrysis_lutea.AAC.6